MYVSSFMYVIIAKTRLDIGDNVMQLYIKTLKDGMGVSIVIQS